MKRLNHDHVASEAQALIDFWEVGGLLILALLGIVVLAWPVNVVASEDSQGSGSKHDSVVLTDFTDTDRNSRWSVVNDNVMGGRSEGEMDFDASGEGVMVLTGDINTNGGGFTSVRMSVEPEIFEDSTDASVFTELRAMRLRVRADKVSLAKPFALRLEDSVPRRLGINFRAELPLDTDAESGGWQTVTVSIDQLQPTHHGRPLDAKQWAPLDTSRLNRVGIMLNNVPDGPYRLEVERIEFLR